MDFLAQIWHSCRDIDLRFAALIAVSVIVGLGWLAYFSLYLVAPVPRPPRSSEKTFVSVDDAGKRSEKRLPCWQDDWYKRKEASRRGGDPIQAGIGIEKAEVFMSLVVPAFNEEQRLRLMLEEATAYLQDAYGSQKKLSNGHAKASKRHNGNVGLTNGRSVESHVEKQGWEILIVSDGSTDRTIETALKYAQELDRSNSHLIRVIQLEKNRGKGGAVTHGLRHVRGHYAVFADADGASKFEDLGKLVDRCEAIEDAKGRGVAVGSRAHLVGSDAVVKRSFLRNFLMHSFHFLLRLLTPPATAAIRDTQCGFKLFSRPSLPYIVPYMHSEGWIFDVEMLMLAEAADIPVAEVPIGWHEVTGSKLNVVWDSLAMAWGLAVLRLAWGLGIYQRS